MNPWITGRIIETMQQEARDRGDRARVGHEATRHHHDRSPVDDDRDREPRRARVGFAVARLGLRIAGRRDGKIVIRRSFAAAGPELGSNR